MKKIALFTLFACMMVIASACGTSQGNSAPEAEDTAYHKIEAKEAKKMIDNNDDIIIIDVRTPEEYKEQHIPDAELIPLDTIEEKAPYKLDNKNATLLVYCRSGSRSYQASQKLVEMGYQNVYDFGGINDWPYDVESVHEE